MAKRSRACLFYICLFCISSVYISYLAVTSNFTFSLFQSNFLVYTSNCKIPNYAKEYLSYAEPHFQNADLVEREKCTEARHQWTYREENKLKFNKTALLQDGYKFKDLSCCYKMVTTSEQPDSSNETTWKKHSECILIAHVQTEFLFPSQVPFEFIAVECSSSKGTDPSLVTYQGFHPIAQPFRSESTMNKIKYWKNHLHFSKQFDEYEDAESPIPPNIVFFGMSFSSRVNFKRRMPKTVKVLESMGAIQMKGYMNSEERDYRSLSVILTGYMEEELDCKLNLNDSYYKCPTIWNRLNQANYLTAYSENGENAPKYSGIAGPPSLKIQHVSQLLADYYMNMPFNTELTDQCFGQEMKNDLLIGYTKALLSMTLEQKVPIFIISLNTINSTLEDTSFLDKTYANSLQMMKENGHLNNTILFFMGGNGPDMIKTTEDTHQNWYEDRLPSLWICLPVKIREAYPELHAALEINSGRPSSPFLFYWSINFIIDKFLPLQPYSSHPEIQPTLPPPVEISVSNHTITNETLPRKFTSHHFFKEIPETVFCSDVGVPELLCACDPHQHQNMKDHS